MEYKGVIFDLDGTLVNSLEDIADSMNLVLQSRNFSGHDLQAYKYLVGNGIRKLVQEALPEAEREEGLINECYNSMIEIYRNNCISKSTLYDGIPDLLDELVSRGIKLAVLSNKADELTRKIASNLLSNWKFEVITGLSAEAYKKPNPLVALQISGIFRIRPENIIYVGDTAIDMHTANNAGMYAVGVLWGFRTKEELTSNGAMCLLNHPLDLIQILNMVKISN
ncbi:MAG: HAD family hydrolase [Candidatus Cloacimonas sp.]